MIDLLEIDAATYYADLCTGPEAPPTLTQSTAHAMLSKSPMHAWRSHPKLGNIERETTLAMDKGTATHDLLLLGKLGDDFTILDHQNYRKKVAQEDRDAVYASGNTPLLRHEYVECCDAAESVTRQLAEFGIPLVGVSERVVLWESVDDGGNVVECRSRLDHVIHGHIFDIKTGADAHPDAVRKKYCDLGYDIQLWAYTEALADGGDPNEVPFLNAFVEMKPPFLCLVAVPDAVFREIGRTKWRRAVNLWSKCRSTGKWPGYADKPMTLSPHAWQVSNSSQEPSY